MQDDSKVNIRSYKWTLYYRILNLQWGISVYCNCFMFELDRKLSESVDVEDEGKYTNI